MTDRQTIQTQLDNLTAQQAALAGQLEELDQADQQAALEKKARLDSGAETIYPSFQQQRPPNFDEDEAKRESIAIAPLMAPRHQGGQNMSREQAQAYWRGQTDPWERTNMLRQGQRFSRQQGGK